METMIYQALLLHYMENARQAIDKCREALTIADEVNASFLVTYALTHLGHSQMDLGHLDAAEQAYAEAVAQRRALGSANRLMGPLAGLAAVLCQRGNLNVAMNHVDEIRQHLTKSTLDGTDDPLQIYLNCFDVMKQSKHPESDKILKDAYVLLMTRSDKILDAELRRSYLENVGVNQSILIEFRKRT